MKFCVSSADNLDVPVDPRFTRCHYFIIVNSENMKIEDTLKTAAEAVGGDGIQDAQMIASKRGKYRITGNLFLEFGQVG